MDGRRVPLATVSLLLLVAVNLFNYIDRQVLAAVEPEIRKELKREFEAANIEISEGEMKTRMGFLSTAFLVTYMVLAPVFGWLANRYSRWKLIGIGVILWSLASGASGWDWQLGPVMAYWALLLTRCFVGVGEGGYGPVAPTMLADLYPIERRGQVMAIFYLAIPVGGAIGYAFGEIVMQNLGWRWAFFLVVPPGIALGAICFFMREPPRQLAKDQKGTIGEEFQNYREIVKIPSYVLNCLGMTAMTFAIGGLAFWMPDFLDRRQAQAVAGLGPRTLFGVVTVLAGLTATLSGGWAGDRLRSWHPGSYFLVSGTAMFLAFPMILGFLYTPFTDNPALAWLFVFGAVFCLFFNTGPTNTILANVTTPDVRASGFALNILVIHLLGDAISPPIIGFLIGTYGDEVAFFLLAFVVLVGGIFWIWGSAYLDRDTRRAEAAVNPDLPHPTSTH